MVKLRGGDAMGEIAALRQAVALEAGAPIEFVPPMVAKPSFEPSTARFVGPAK